LESGGLFIDGQIFATKNLPILPKNVVFGKMDKTNGVQKRRFWHDI
jgi:hypothetical protein